MKSWLPPETLNRIAANPDHRMQEPQALAIDLSKPFVPEDYTQLAFTPVYRALEPRHRLRYNQLFGLRINEYIMMLEADLVERLLRPLMRHPAIRSDAALLEAIRIMIEEERVHYRIFAALNQRCAPGIYANGRERYFSELGRAARFNLALIGLSARWLAFPLWYLMAMEESSTALARDMIRPDAGGGLGPLEASFVAVHREHMKDEARHLQVDGHLIEACLMKGGKTGRSLNARLFKRMLAPITRVERTGSGVKVIRHLVAEHPELRPLEERMIEEVLALTNDARFQASLFNRRAMPLTFGLFDAMDELGSLSERMVGYDRRSEAP